MDLFTIGAIVAGVVALAVIIAGVLSVRSEADILEDRLEDTGVEEFSLNLGAYDATDEPTLSEPEVSLRERLTSSVDSAIAERAWAKRMRNQLSRADIKLTVAEFAMAHLVAMSLAFAVSYFLIFRFNLIFSILAGFVGLFAPRIYVARQVSTRLIRFETQLPDTLGLWVNALRSGYSVLQAMEAIAKDSPEPTSTEFKRVVQEVQLGIDMEDALDHLLARVDSEDLDLVVTAVNIQREVGGNLAEILEVISNTIRERIKLKGEIRVLTSQGRITGYLISFLPIVLAIFLSIINPSFMNPLFTNRMCGWPMIGIGLALIGIGTAVIQKIIDIEI